MAGYGSLTCSLYSGYLSRSMFQHWPRCIPLNPATKQPPTITSVPVHPKKLMLTLDNNLKSAQNYFNIRLSMMFIALNLTSFVMISWRKGYCLYFYHYLWGNLFRCDVQFIIVQIMFLLNHTKYLNISNTFKSCGLCFP